MEGVCGLKKKRSGGGVIIPNPSTCDSPFPLALHLYSTDNNDNEYMKYCYTNDLGSSFPVKRNFSPTLFAGQWFET
jgi:hypothetical protein